MSFTSEGRGKDRRSGHAQGEAQTKEETPQNRNEAGDVGDAAENAGRGSVLERAFQVLEQVASGARPLNLTEMSRAARLPLPTTYRLAKSLVKLGALEKDAGRYTLGPVWLEWCGVTEREHPCTPN
ncbi:helix-turn-helix domain-containing protein [Saccharothrix longispora]|uniref:helix-turn-helix domain-containing protein n=1 Tax=Saccharothrix longispora TaxID=33920 RepID=UPI0028FD9F87|nr:helix-turn-helix domain-containing protein [Saccharothrix longispora]MDU0293001.1 helix-turn-helix domain-containing protein [Saccharothrix longispora]